MVHRSATPQFRWQVNWKICAFSLLMFPVLLGLGFWQLERAESKETLQQSIQQQQGKPVLAWQDYINAGEQTATIEPFRRVRLTGEFDSDTVWLLENQVANQQVGYHVLMPFVTSESAPVIVNRGWIAGTGYRDQLPSVATPEGEVQLIGHVHHHQPNRLLRDAQVTAVGEGMRLILTPEPAKLARDYGASMRPEIIRLEAGSPGALAVDWQPITVGPERHQGYAVQWFSMAAVLFVLTLLANSNLPAVIRAKSRPPA